MNFDAIKKTFFSRPTFKPKSFPVAEASRDAQLMQAWTANQINFAQDYQDLHTLKTSEIATLKRILMFFTQADLNVQHGQLDFFTDLFNGCPELAGMISAFNTIESVHADAYSAFVDIVDDDYGFYEEFKQHEVFRELHAISIGIPDKIADITSFEEFFFVFLSCFIIPEGVYLFTFFVLLLSYYVKDKKFPGLEEVVRYSMRDESLHVISYREIILAMDDKNCSDSKLLATWDSVAHKEKHKTLERQVRILDFIFDDLETINGITKNQLLKYAEYNYHRFCYFFDAQIPDGNIVNPFEWIETYNDDLSIDFFSRVNTKYANCG